jgi:flagellar hook-basal body complex protein FliE
MVNPVSSNLPTPVRPTGAPGAPDQPAPAAQDGGFAAELRRQLEEVGRLQNEADQAMQDLLTGRTDNVTQVLTMARKAEVAFSLLMEIRNKLVDAYIELRQLRV